MSGRRFLARAPAHRTLISRRRVGCDGPHRAFEDAMTRTLTLMIGCLAMLGPAAAQTPPPATAPAQAPVEAAEVRVPLVAGKPFLHVMHQGRSVKVQRIQDPEFELKGYYAKTARTCPPFCLHPIEAAPGVRTVGEVEVFDFMEGKLRDGTGLLIDSRTDEWYKKGTIPGAIHVPFDRLALDPNDPKWGDLLKPFGVKPRGEEGAVQRALGALGLAADPLKTAKWDFTEAKDLMLFCNGPACDQSPREIQSLISVGYPVSRLNYYRGGMQDWQMWGLTTVVPAQ
jgi:rhodanese-related sulfurtransferase